MTPRVLFVTRKYPPSVGGMQEHLFQVYRRIGRCNRAWKLSLGRSQAHLAWFLPWALLAGGALAIARRVTHVHVGDALLAPLGLLLARAAGAEASVTTYGLDVVYPPAWYQWMIRTALPSYDAVVCISEATRDECLDRGVAPDACHVVTPGTTLHRDGPAAEPGRARARLAERLSRPVSGAPLLLCLGRHVRRKGFAWFVEAVMPTLPASTQLFVAGDGPGRARVEEAARSAQVAARVHVLGRVPAEVKRLLLEAADVLVMPNRSVEGDMEGFGLVAPEASAMGTPVVAAGIEGIRDAVLDGDTGLLVPEGDADAFREAILAARSWDRTRVKEATEASFSWDRTYAGYAEALGLRGLDEEARGVGTTGGDDPRRPRRTVGEGHE